MYVWTLFALALAGVCSADATRNKRPNIILVLTDDQSINTLAKREFAPHIYKHLVDHGTLYENAFAPVSVCCPSRTSLLRTQLAHSHNVTSVSRPTSQCNKVLSGQVNAPWGGFTQYQKYGYNGHALPDFLQQAQYNTYYVGKYLNEHTIDNCETFPVPGWNKSDFLVDPYTYNYWKPAISSNNGPAKVLEGQYSTDVVKQKALADLEDGLSHIDERPFFLGVAPIACHSWISEIPKDLRTQRMDIPGAHWRHQNLFATEQLPRVPSWNKTGGVSWVKELEPFNATVESYFDEFYRGRLRTLQAVDEMVDEVVQRLEAAGQLDNTYIIYTADNGFAIGTHRRQPSKTLSFEEDVHIPLIIRGPGVDAARINSIDSVSIVDISATILALANATADHVIDGQPIPLLADDALRSDVYHHPFNLVEYWVLTGSEGIYNGDTVHGNTTYRSLRVHEELGDKNITLVYSVWCTGERELYDLTQDASQLDNLLAPLNKLGRFAPFDALDVDGQHIVSPDLQTLLHRLDAIVLVLKDCAGETCTRPLKALFPDPLISGDVSTFHKSLSPRFDAYFAQLPKVEFHHCFLGYQSRFEHPLWNPAYGYGYGSGFEKATPPWVIQNGH